MKKEQDKVREYVLHISDIVAFSMKDFAEDKTGNYNPYEDFKVVAEQVKSQVDAKFKEYSR